jgi:hypothetical protein
MEATSKLDLSDEDFEALIAYFKDNKIKVISDEEEETTEEAPADERRFSTPRKRSKRMRRR